MTDRRVGRIGLAALVGVAFLIGAVGVVISFPGANQYELSLYDAYPLYFWGLVVGAIFIGSLIILASARVPADRSWMYGLLLVLGSNALVVLQPSIRGYYMFGRSDALTHIGYVRDIVSDGGFIENVYPPTHVLVLAVAEATGLDLMAVGVFLPVVLSGIYFGAMFYLLVYLFDSRERVLFGLPFVMLPVLHGSHVMLRPFDFSVLLLPLVLYLFIKSQRNSAPAARAAFVIALTALLLYHPLTALFVLTVFGMYFVIRHAPRIRTEYATPTNFLSLSAAIFAAWYSKFSGIIRRFSSVYERLFGFQQGDAPVQSYTEAAQEASPALIDIVRVMSFKYGVEFLLFGLGFAFVALFAYLAVRRRYAPSGYVLALTGTLVLFSFGGLAFLLLDLIVPQDRPFQIAKIAAAVLVGQLFYLLYEYVDWTGYRSRLETGLRVSLSITVLTLVVLSTFSVYMSPLAAGSNHQVTEMEVEGTQWVTEHGKKSNGLVMVGLSHRRYYHALQGVDTPTFANGSTAPRHFNYTEFEYLGQGYSNDRYLLITRLGRIVYPGVFPDYRSNWRYFPEDFERVQRDRTAAQIYDNGDYDQYLIDSSPA